MQIEPSQALPRQLSQRESQAVKFVTKVLSITRKFPAVLLALPLGELAPQVTERAHVVSLFAKVSVAIRNFPSTAKTRSLWERWHGVSRDGEGAGASSLCKFISAFPPGAVFICPGKCAIL